MTRVTVQESNSEESVDSALLEGKENPTTSEDMTHRSSARSAAGCIVATRRGAVAGADGVRHVCCMHGTPSASRQDHAGRGQVHSRKRAGVYR